MKLHEVLEKPDVLSGEKWIVPTAWKPSPIAYCVREGLICLVPSARSIKLGITAHIDALAGEWSIVEPSEILDYRDRLRGAP